MNGTTNELLRPNQSRAVALLEQLMDMDLVPTVIDATLILDGGGGGGGGLIELDARLQVGDCDSSFVSWNAGGGDGALHITSTWVKQPPFGEVYMAAQVSGDVVYFSDGFLTVPEPDDAAGLIATVGALAMLARGRARRSARR